MDPHPGLCLLGWGSSHFIILQHWLMSLWGMTVTTPHTQNTGCSRSRLWCAFPTDTIVHSTWTSSKIVACSWLVSVVRCFWSSSLVLDEFIPVGREKSTKGKFSVELPPSHTHPPTSGCGHRQQWRHCEVLDTKHQTCAFYWILKTTPREYAPSQLHIQEDKDTEFINQLRHPFVLCRGCSSPQITYLVVKYHRQSKHFLQKCRALLTTWEHENTFLRKSKRCWAETEFSLEFYVRPLHTATGGWPSSSRMLSSLKTSSLAVQRILRSTYKWPHRRPAPIRI